MIAVGERYSLGLVAVEAHEDGCVGCFFLQNGDCAHPHHARDCSGESYVIFVPLLADAPGHTL